jgi:hypothetical protein
MECPKALTPPSSPPASGDFLESKEVSPEKSTTSPRLRQRNSSTSSVNTVLGVRLDTLIKIDQKPSRIPVLTRKPTLAILNPGAGQPAETILTSALPEIPDEVVVPSLKQKSAIDFNSLHAKDTGLGHTDGWLQSDDQEQADHVFNGPSSVHEFDALSSESFSSIPQRIVKPRASIKFLKQHVELWDPNFEYDVSRLLDCGNNGL